MFWRVVTITTLLAGTALLMAALRIISGPDPVTLHSLVIEWLIVGAFLAVPVSLVGVVVLLVGRARQESSEPP